MKEIIEYSFYTSLIAFGSYVVYNIITRKKDPNSRIQKEVKKKVSKALNISQSDLQNKEKVLTSLYEILVKYKEKELYTEEEVKEIIVKSAERVAEKTFEEFSMKIAQSIESYQYFEDPEKLLEQIPYNEILITFTNGIKSYLKENESYNNLPEEEKEKILKQVLNKIKEKYNKTIEIKSEEIEEIFKEILKTTTTQKLTEKKEQKEKAIEITQPTTEVTHLKEKPKETGIKLIKDIGLKEEAFTSSVITKKIIEEFQKTIEYYGLYTHFKEFIKFFVENINNLNGNLFPEGELSIHVKDLIQTLKEYIEEIEQSTNFNFNLETFNTIIEEDIKIIYSQKTTNYEFYIKILTGEIAFRHPLFYQKKTDLFRTNLFRYLPVYQAFLDKEQLEEIKNNTIEFLKENANKRQIGLVKNAIIKKTETGDYEEVIENFDVVALKVREEPLLITWKGIALHLGEKYTYFEFLFKDILRPNIKRNGLNIYIDPIGMKVNCSFTQKPREFKYLYRANLNVEKEECEKA